MCQHCHRRTEAGSGRRIVIWGQHYAKLPISVYCLDCSWSSGKFNVKLAAIRYQIIRIKCKRNQFWLEICPRSRWGSLQRSQTPSCSIGTYFWGNLRDVERGRRGNKEKGRSGKVREMWTGREGKVRPQQKIANPALTTTFSFVELSIHTRVGLHNAAHP